MLPEVSPQINVEVQIGLFESPHWLSKPSDDMGDCAYCHVQPRYYDKAAIATCIGLNDCLCQVYFGWTTNPPAPDQRGSAVGIILPNVIALAAQVSKVVEEVSLELGLALEPSLYQEVTCWCILRLAYLPDGQLIPGKYPVLPSWKSWSLSELAGEMPLMRNQLPLFPRNPTEGTLRDNISAWLARLKTEILETS